MVEKVRNNFLGHYHQEIFFSSLVLGLVFLDQLLKLLIINFKPQINLKILEIVFIKNTGAGFGILQNQTFWLALISLLVAVAIIWNYRKIPTEKTTQSLFAVFLGGVLGNLIDRLLRGYVIDFINFRFWPAFNLADACISLSVIGLVVWYWKKN